MSACLSEGLESALEIFNNLDNKPNLTRVQNRNYQMAKSLITLALRLLHTTKDTSDLEILKQWHGIKTNNGILNFYLAKRPDNNHYLYSKFNEMDNLIGLYIKETELDKIL